MRYYLTEDSIFIRGSFSAAGTGPCGGLKNISTIILRNVVDPHSDPCIDIRTAARGEGLSENVSGLITSSEITRLCILKYDFITVFLISGKAREDRPGEITIIACSAEGMSESALLQSIITVTEAKAGTMIEKRGITGTPDDHVIIAGEGPVSHNEGGPGSETGLRITECVRYGLPLALDRDKAPVRPSLYVFSRFGGGHFVEWRPEGCPYYPCHFEGQRCDFCYCPFYPCRNEELGQWVKSSNGGLVWNCSRCTLLHEPVIADYLTKHPDASLEELMKREAMEKKNLCGCNTES